MEIQKENHLKLEMLLTTKRAGHEHRAADHRRPEGRLRPLDSHQHSLHFLSHGIGFSFFNCLYILSCR